MTDDPKHWWIFRGKGEPHDGVTRLPDPPPWRRFSNQAEELRGAVFAPEDHEVEMVNAAMYLRRPLLITGRAGIGKTTLAYAVARELKLGRVLRWSVTTQSTLREALYRYDAVGRLQETALRRDQTMTAAMKDKDTPPPAVPIDRYLRLGPLGTAFADSKRRPRVLLVDEIDKSDVDLPNDLLHIFEEGEFEIPELARLPADQQKVALLPHDPRPREPTIPIVGGRVRCGHFPIVFLTSNGERSFPPAFLRRCLQLHMDWPKDHERKQEKLARIVRRHLDFSPDQTPRVDELIGAFVRRLENHSDDLATDQLLNALYLVLKNVNPEHAPGDAEALLNALWRSLSK